MNHVKLALKGLNAIQVRLYAGRIIKGLDGNISFPNPFPDIPTLRQKCDELSAAIIAAASRSTLAIQKRESLKSEMAELIRLSAQFVQFASRGNAQLIRSTGFEVKEKGRKSTSPLPSPQKLKVLAIEGLSGQLKLRFKGVRGAKAYTIMMSADQAFPLSWVMAGTAGKTSFVVTKLTPGVIYSFKVAAIGSDNISGVFSTEVSRMAI